MPPVDHPHPAPSPSPAHRPAAVLAPSLRANPVLWLDLATEAGGRLYDLSLSPLLAGHTVEHTTRNVSSNGIGLQPIHLAAGDPIGYLHWIYAVAAPVRNFTEQRSRALHGDLHAGSVIYDRRAQAAPNGRVGHGRPGVSANGAAVGTFWIIDLGNTDMDGRLRDGSLELRDAEAEEEDEVDGEDGGGVLVQGTVLGDVFDFLAHYMHSSLVLPTMPTKIKLELMTAFIDGYTRWFPTAHAPISASIAQCRDVYRARSEMARELEAVLPAQATLDRWAAGMAQRGTPGRRRRRQQRRRRQRTDQS